MCFSGDGVNSERGYCKPMQSVAGGKKREGNPEARGLII